MTTNNKPAYLVIDFDVASLDKVESFKSALAIALLHDDSEFVPEEENDTIYSTKKEGFYRVIAKDGDVKDEILEELINGTLIVPQRILDRALDVEATFLDESLNVNPLIVTYPQQTTSHEDEQTNDTEVQNDQEQDNQHSTYHLVKELLPDTEQLLDKLSEPLEVEPAALTSPNVVLLKSQLDTSLNQMQLLVDDQLSAAIRSGALQSSVQDVSKRLVDAPPSEILDYQLALEKQVKYREELNDQVDLIKGSYNEGLESYIESKIPELRAEYLATHPDDTDVRVAEFLAEHAHELVSVEEGVVNTREKAEAKVLHSVIENASASELRKIMKLLKAKELYQRTLDDVVKAWHATQGRKEDVQSTIIEPQHFEAPAVETQQETEKETVQDDVKHDDDVDLSFLEDSSLDDIEAQLHQRIETSAQQERDAHEQSLHTNVEQEKTQKDTFDHLEDENVDLEEAEETHTTVVPAPVTVPKIDYSAITASDDDEDVDLEDADESEDNEDVLNVKNEEPAQQAAQLDTHIGTVANEVESNDDDEIIEDAQPAGEIDVDSMFEELNTGEVAEEVTKPVKQSLSKKTKLIAGGVTAGIVLLTAGGIYASQHLFNSPSQETTQQESTAATQQESETTIATTIVSVGDTLRVSVGGKEMNVKVIEVKSDGSATVETPDGEKLAIPYESLKTLLEK